MDGGKVFLRKGVMRRGTCCADGHGVGVPPDFGDWPETVAAFCRAQKRPASSVSERGDGVPPTTISDDQYKR